MASVRSAAVGSALLWASVLGWGQAAEEIRRLNNEAATGLPPAVFARRAKLMYELIRESPQQALELALRWPPTNSGGAVESFGEWEGVLEGTVEDDFERRTSRTRWKLRTPEDGIELYLTGTPPTDCSRRIRVRGVRLRDRVAVESWTAQGSVSAAAGCAATTGPQSLAVVMVRTPTHSLPAAVTASALQNAFFGAAQSVDGYWRNASYGLTSATGNVFGPFTLDADYTCDQFDPILTATIKAADSTVNLTQFSRLVIIMPYFGTCSIGLGSIGCRTLNSPLHGNFSSSVAWLRADFLSANDAIVSVSVHELGHGMGLNHASTLSFTGAPLGPFGTGVHDEYGDYISQMGLSYSFNGSYLLGHYAAPHKSQLGWLGPGNFQNVSSPGTFTLAPLETITSALQVIRVQRSPASNAWLWIEYRQPLGYDATLSPVGMNFGGAVIHYEDPLLSAAYNAGYTHLLNFHPGGAITNAPLAAGEAWQDPYSLLHLTVNSASGSGLNLTVGYDSPCASLAPSAPSLGASAGQSTITVSAALGCSWTAVSNTPWIAIVGGATGNGNGTVTYSVTANSGGTRSGTMTVGRQDVTVTQSSTGCGYTLVTSGASSSAAGGPGSVGLTAGAGCAWQGISAVPWIIVTAGSAGVGSGIVSYNVTANPGSVQRLGTIVIAGRTFTITQAGVRSVYPRDFRGVGRSDVFLYDPVGNAYTGLSNGAGTFSYIFQPYTPGLNTLRTGDFNGDGKADMVVYNSTSALAYIGLGNGDGTFNFQSLFWGPGFDNVVAGDLNGDGKTDFVLYRSSDGTMYTALSNGTGGFTYHYTLVSVGFTHARVADFNGDGKADVFFYRPGDGLAYLGLSNGDGTFTFSAITPGTGFDFVQAADLNGDGKADLLLYASSSGATRTAISTGSGFAFATQSYSSGFSAVRLLDLIGDGKSDIVLYNKTNGLGYFGIGVGDGTFTFGSVFWGLGMDNVEPQDLNGDGKADIVLYNSATGTAYAGIGDGAGGFAYTYSYWGIGKILAK